MSGKWSCNLTSSGPFDTGRTNILLKIMLININYLLPNWAYLPIRIQLYVDNLLYYIQKTTIHLCTTKMEDKEYLKQFAQRVRTLREEQGISQEKLAERSDLHRTYIGMVERLERNPSLVCIHKIANGLGVHITELFQ